MQIFCSELVLNNWSIHAIFPVTELVLLMYRSFLAISLCLPSDTAVWRRHQWYGTSHSSSDFLQQTGIRRWTLFQSVAKITHKILESECNHLGPFKAALRCLTVLFQLLIIGILKYSSTNLEIPVLFLNWVPLIYSTEVRSFIFQVNLTNAFSLSNPFSED